MNPKAVLTARRNPGVEVFQDSKILLGKIAWALTFDCGRVTGKPEVIPSAIQFHLFGKSENRTCAFLRFHFSGFGINQALTGFL